MKAPFTTTIEMLLWIVAAVLGLAESHPFVPKYVDRQVPPLLTTDGSTRWHHRCVAGALQVRGGQTQSVRGEKSTFIVVNFWLDFNTLVRHGQSHADLFLSLLAVVFDWLYLGHSRFLHDCAQLSQSSRLWSGWWLARSHLHVRC